nr:hypothetical protein [Tanacetum cinerariifolium]
MTLPSQSLPNNLEQNNRPHNKLSNVKISSLLYMYFFVDQMPLPIIVKRAWTMASTINQQVALDESLVPSTQRLRIGISNFRLPSDIQSKESTLQATAKLHHNFIRFKIDTKKIILDLEAFREMLHISPRIPSQSFAELPFEVEILDFLRFLGHSHEILHLTDVNVEHKNQKRSNEMYSRFTKVIIDYFMTRKPSISRRNKINWHYIRDDVLFSTIKVVSRHQTTQQYGAILPIELTTDEIRNNVGNDNLDIEVAHMGNDPLLGVPITKVASGQSSSTASPQSIVQPNHPMTYPNSKWTKDHPLNYIIGPLSRPVSTGYNYMSKPSFAITMLS